MRNSTNRYLRAKVWVTFFIILTVVVTAVWWSFRTYQKLTGSINQLSEPDEKTVLIQNTLQGITKSENYIKSYILTNKPGMYTSYQNENKEIQQNIDELKRKMAEDSLQIQKVDSLEMLFLQKLNYLSDFLMAKKERQSKNYTSEALEKITESTVDSTEVHSRVRTNLRTTEEMKPKIKRSVVETEYKAPGLWEGIRRLFGAKNIRIDTITRIENDTIRAIEVSIDTLTITNYNPDTMLIKVKQILEEVANKELQSQYLLSSKELSLLQQDILLHEKIDKIIRQLNQYEQKNLRKRRNEGYQIAQNSTRAVLAIGVLGIVFGGVFLFAIGRDITRSYYLSKRLEMERNKADQLAKIKEEFLANMSHEIRTPLNSILGFSGLLDKTELNQNQQMFSRALSENTKYLIGLVNDILDVSKLNFRKLELSEERFQIGDIVQHMESLFSIQCKEKGLEFRTYYEAKLNKVDLIGDGFRIKQILTNLLSNAIKFTEQGYIELSIRARKKIDRYHLNIKVTDTGKGIEPGKFKSIFNTFEQEDASVTKKYGGTGLGLSIVKKLIEAMQGKITVKSRLNEQTTFTVQLNLPFKQHTERKVLPDTINDVGTYKGHIVVVDDDKWNAMLLRTILTPKVSRLTVFNSPGDAVEFIKKQYRDIDMIMTDINMPEISGLDILNMLKSAEQGPPVIAVTAHVIPSKLKAFSQKGFSDVITKPYNEEDMDRVLTKHLKTNQVSVVASSVVPDTQRTDSSGPSFNFDKIKQFSGDDSYLLVELINELVQSNEKNLKEFTYVLETQNLDLLSDISHKMIQTYESLDLLSIAEKLRNIEVYHQLDRNEEMLTMAHELLPLLEHVASRLEELRPQFYT